MGKYPLLALAMLFSACSSAPVSFWPNSMFMADFPPPGPPNYQQGMIEGCKTALGAVGGGLYTLIYNDVYYDVDKALNDDVYYKAWKDGFLYCKYEHDKGPE